jgi:glycosyltransferase involved in cell wall biosynthesis
MPKLIIQVPCYNEERNVAVTLRQLPRHVEGFDSVEWLVVNDGSSDGTSDEARRHGADQVLDLGYHRGLAAAFMAGVDASLERGADVIVNVDGDNQYCAADIPAVVGPVLRGEADIVIGARPIASIRNFSRAKKALQALGSWVVRSLSGAAVMDAPSGFRAFSREAALRLKVFSSYTYTLETIVQAATCGMRIVSVPVRVNPPLRESRLIRSTARYVLRSLATLCRVYYLYRPFRVFAVLAAPPLAAGIFLTGRWLYLNWYEYPITGRLHIPSLIVAVLNLALGAGLLLAGVMAELQATNRRLLEEVRYMVRKRQFAGGRAAEPQPSARRQAGGA